MVEHLVDASVVHSAGVLADQMAVRWDVARGESLADQWACRTADWSDLWRVGRSDEPSAACWMGERLVYRRVASSAGRSGQSSVVSKVGPLVGHWV